MTLRSKVQEAITQGDGDVCKAALLVCLLLEDQIGLSGNGWFDDDQAVLDALIQEDDEQ